MKDQKTEQITAIYNQVKAAYKNNVSNETALDVTVDTLERCLEEFEKEGERKGVLFAKKGIAVVHMKYGDTLAGVDQLDQYETAHSIINETVDEANKINWTQPSLLKHQGTIKAKLGSALHSAGNHIDGNVLMCDSMKKFREMFRLAPQYGEGTLAFASASLERMKWQAGKLKCDLNRAQRLLKRPKYTRHLPDANEHQAHATEILEIQNRLENLLQVI